MNKKTRTPIKKWLKSLSKRYRSFIKINLISKVMGLKCLETNPLISAKKSDTIFVLGCGVSINTYQPAQWALIAKNDSFGLNYWMLHDFVPNFYMTEVPKFQSDVECMTKNLDIKSANYSKTKIFIKDIEKYSTNEVKDFFRAFPPKLLKETHPLWDLEIDGESEAEFSTALKTLDRQGAFDLDSQQLLPRKRASIFLACAMAVRAGYKNIVLCGVDLKDADYFFYHDQAKYEAQGLYVPPNLQPGTVHKTNDPEHGALTISKILDVFDREILQPKGIKLFVALNSSALWPRFPTYFQP